jgi:hypothetical protein
MAGPKVRNVTFYGAPQNNENYSDAKTEKEHFHFLFHAVKCEKDVLAAKKVRY